jgi:hypothetical protein
MTDEEVYKEAKKRVKAKKDFYGNLGAWAAVNTILIIIWALTSRDQPGVAWFLYPLCIWGAVVIINGLNVFVFGKQSDIGAIEKEAEKIKKEQG